MAKYFDSLRISFRYNGAGIKLGECGLTILSAEHNHSGTWSCHMGATHVAQTDTVREISVRIAGNDVGINLSENTFSFSNS